MADMWDFLINRDKRTVPCEGCEFEDTCANEVTECTAMRNWQQTGDFKDKDVKRLRRLIKV